jgi:hypothetical protein
MTAFRKDATVVATDSHVATDVDGETVLLNKETGLYQGLTGIGPHIWEAVQEPTTFEELVERVADEYDIGSAQCERDIREFLAELADEQLVEIDGYEAE